MDLSRSSEGVGRSPAPLEIADNLPDAMVTKSGDFDEKKISFGSLVEKCPQILRYFHGSESHLRSDNDMWVDLQR